ncbi:MAG TPA: hypothetical protein VFS25_09375 [Chitinophaga sp.]|uniref:hypothetical protein n=1 Tax=Chitinophaga sp. TaxID=1869181 RepID=UPI002DB96E3A|nr:hypothetical protein [Chitinophaga sp.]HEU4553034.1 hypothetical protein [Chitinophaga sp.]
MLFAIIFLRVLFVACMVFIIGHVFGSFSKRPALRIITKIAVILTIVLFISGNILFFRFAHVRAAHYRGYHTHCMYEPAPQQPQHP